LRSCDYIYTIDLARLTRRHRDSIQILKRRIEKEGMTTEPKKKNAKNSRQIPVIKVKSGSDKPSKQSFNP
jgi:hypothetical protein